MKSTNEQLKNRGFAFDEDIILYKNYNEKELLKLLQDKEAYKRTIAVKLLSNYKKENHIQLFCETLKRENKLYTKIELCTILESYGEKAILCLMPLLGTIGKNQHTKIELVDINKKSYPLPRDIVGRILIRIGPKVFPELKKILLEDKNINQIPEAIDVIGHITCNHKDYSMEKNLLKYFNKNKGNEFIEWKIVRAFQAFKSQEIKNILENIIKTHKNKIITDEAKRSMARMGSV
jgi:HEAT repeat protein